MKRAFTVIELVFVVVVLGILASVAIPKIFATRQDAVIAKTKSQISAIQSAIINLYSTNMLSGLFEYPELDKSGENGLFGNVLQTAITPKSANESYGWTRNGQHYIFEINKKSTTFTYDKSRGQFFCNPKDELCVVLTK